MRITRSVAAIAVPVLLAVSLLTACGGDDDADSGGGGSTTSATIDIDGRTFLSTTVTVGGQDHPLVGGTRISLTFTDGRIGASAGCNTMGGDYTLEGDTLRVGGLSTTEMGCDPERDAQDTWLADVLTGSPTLRLSGSELTLTTEDAAITLVDREVAEPDSELTGTRWTLESIVEGETVSSIPLGVEATFEISDDGTVAVNLGCNSGSGTAEIGDGTLTFAAIAVTTMGCEGPEMQVQSSVLAVVGAEVTYAIDADLLSMRKGDRGLDWRAEH